MCYRSTACSYCATSSSLNRSYRREISGHRKVLYHVIHCACGVRQEALTCRLPLPQNGTEARHTDSHPAYGSSCTLTRLAQTWILSQRLLYPIWNTQIFSASSALERRVFLGCRADRRTGLGRPHGNEWLRLQRLNRVKSLGSAAQSVCSASAIGYCAENGRFCREVTLSGMRGRLLPSCSATPALGTTAEV